MQNFFHTKQSPEDIYRELRVKEYINRYIKEIQRHFDVSDKKMRKIIYNIYLERSPFNFIKSWIYMLKSQYGKKIKIKRK